MGPFSITVALIWGLSPAASPPHLVAMIISVLIASAVIGLMLVLLVQGQWTSLDSWFVAILASAVMVMVIGQYVDLMRLPGLGPLGDGTLCLPSALMRQIGWVEEGRISSSS
jgi:hypothetical protein